MGSMPDSGGWYGSHCAGALDREGQAGVPEPRQQVVPHRDGGGDLTRGRRVVVEGQAQGRLGEHLRGLGVARVTTADLRDDAAPTGLADEAHREVRPGAPVLAGSLPLWHPAGEEASDRADLGAEAQDADRRDPGEGGREPPERGVVAVAEVGPVPVQGGGGPAYDGGVDGRRGTSQNPVWSSKWGRSARTRT